MQRASVTGRDARQPASEPSGAVDVAALAVGVGLFVGIACALRLAGVDVLRSDAVAYLRWSHRWWELEQTNHLPLYPFALWFGRTVSFGLLDGALLLQSVTLASWIAGVVFAGKGLALWLGSTRAARLGSTVFGLFPFTGVSYAVYPVSDAVALALVAAGFYFYVKRSWWAFMVTACFGLLSHKGVWPAFLLLSLVGNLRHRYPWWMTVLSGSGFVLWIVVGAVHFGDVLWLFRLNFQHHLTSRAALPVLDGVVGTLAAGGLEDTAKGAYLAALLTCSVLLAVRLARSRKWTGAALAASMLVWLMVLGPLAIWAAARFAKVLAVPIAAFVSEHDGLLERASRPGMRGLLVAVLGGTQILATYHMFTVYFA